MSQMAYIIVALLVCVTVIVVTLVLAKRGVSAERTQKITRLIFVSTQVSALLWVYISYAIALYSTIVLEQVYTMAELSEPAINTILGVGILKVVENIFEHNEGFIFGKSKCNEDNDQAA